MGYFQKQLVWEKWKLDIENVVPEIASSNSENYYEAETFNWKIESSS